jgi:hypothetical protein
VPSVKAETAPPPMSAPGQRLRRDALRILAQNLKGRRLSPSEAEHLLATHGTLEASLRAVRPPRTRERWSGRFSDEGIVGTEAGTLQPLWIVRVAAVVELLLAGLFLRLIR